ncbi:hypothetical protein OEZ85_002453 [Tetradesmus obliquus]|uniref:Ubiquitin-like protease family profile domain-containing protein n=1 Tax=Tetradesmus obliquus TaxID=3088 RepID=A0ABY8U077_TETOB|nr:hypothetical protein OEZ85_002453 [Tetradesmus obliquus]
MNNTFRQLQANEQRSLYSPAFAGGSQPKQQHRFFAGGVPPMRPSVDPNSTPLHGYASAAEAAAPAAIRQQLQQQAAARLAGAVPAAARPAAPGSSQQQQQQEEEDSDVICLSSGDEDDEQQQQHHVDQQAEQYSEEEGSGSEEEQGEEEEEESEEEEEEGGVAAAAAGVDRLRLDRWLGRRSNWTPTQQQLERFEAAVGPGPGSELLASHECASIELRREHMLCLQRSEWLNDEVINMYVAMLQDRDTALRQLPGSPHPRCHFFSTFFLNKLYKDEKKYNYKNVRRWTVPGRLKNAGQASDNVLDLDRIIVPVHEGVHWTAIMADLANKRIVFFDSLNGHNPWAIDSLRRWLADEAKDKRGEAWDTASWEVACPEDIPRQANGCDCGVFSLLFCNRLGLGVPFDFAQADLLVNARVRIACELMDGRLPLPGKGTQ